MEEGLGPDGYNFHFIKSNWEIIKSDVIDTIKCFQNLGYISTGCNASFITLEIEDIGHKKLFHFLFHPMWIFTPSPFISKPFISLIVLLHLF